MGFRSMMVTADFPVEWSEPFVEKYKSWLHFRERDGEKSGAISSKWDANFYSGVEQDIIQDIAAEVRKHWHDNSDDWTFEIVLLHECGGVTKFDVRHDRIDTMIPGSWKSTEGDTGHDYCCGCSRVQRQPHEVTDRE